MTQLKVWHNFLIIFLVLVLSNVSFRLLRPVHAQAETILSFSPMMTELYFNGASTAQVQVVVTDVELLNAFDITITYDPDVAVVTAWSKGDFLSNLFDIVKVNDPGLFRLTTTQLSTPGVSGSGTLINLTFSATGAGSTPLTFTAVTLSNSSSQPIPTTLQDGTLSAGYISYSISGSVFAQGQASRGGIPVSLGVGPTYGQGPFPTTSAPEVGLNLAFSAVPNGDSYLITTGMPGALNLDTALGKTVTVAGQDILLPPLGLLSGNAVWSDNVIDDVDLDAIRDAFDTLGSGMDADVNQDGVVDVRDLALAGGNYGLTSEDAYAGWSP